MGMRTSTLQSKFWRSTSAKYLIVLGIGSAHSLLGHGPLSSKDIPGSVLSVASFARCLEKEFPADRNGKLQLQRSKTSWYLKVPRKTCLKICPVTALAYRSLLL